MNTSRIAALTLMTVLISACAQPGGAADEAACLQGEWEMSNADLNLMLTTLIPLSGMSIPEGTLRLTIDGDHLLYFSEGYLLRLEVEGGYMDAEITFETEGTFTARHGKLKVADIISNQDVSTWWAVIDGETKEVPGVSEVSIPLPGSGPFTCNASTLTVTSSIPAVEALVMVFHR